MSGGTPAVLDHSNFFKNVYLILVMRQHSNQQQLVFKCQDDNGVFIKAYYESACKQDDL